MSYSFMGSDHQFSSAFKFIILIPDNLVHKTSSKVQEYSHGGILIDVGIMNNAIADATVQGY